MVLCRLMTDDGGESHRRDTGEYILRTERALEVFTEQR